MTPAVVTNFKRCTVTDVVATALRQGVVCPSNVHSVICFCEKVVPTELLESVVFEQKAGCTRKSRVHSNQPVLPQGFVLHSFRDHTSRRNMKDRPRTRASHSNKTCAEDRGSKSTRRQTRTSTMPPDNERQSALNVHRVSAKTRSPTLLEQH